ncbi:unnamed protein product [Brassicogethes aeneus]|uniref:Uncharacterized protein n=1 Tax=Brassicogethes aeneus TaxID=1431903 RepID=A0A9P0BH78_BRAAE|nr:unnamed protein product [Brassicogethes aeneus]
MAEVTKVYTSEEMQKIAPNFKSDFKTRKPNPKSVPVKDRDSTVPRPRHLEANKHPTPQINEPILSEAIYGIDVTVYLREVGSYTDKMGKEQMHNVPPLPVAVAQHFGGYHSAVLDIDTHNFFEEIPSLGIARDVLMAVASQDAEPLPNFRFGIPDHSEVTTNLVGKPRVIGERRPAIRQRLALPPNIVGKFETYKVEKITNKNLGQAGEETQVIKTIPSEPNEQERWIARSGNIINIIIHQLNGKPWSSKLFWFSPL